jgi:uncharacterized protein (DUF305 family)
MRAYARRTALAAVVATAAFSLTACGGSGGSATSVSHHGSASDSPSAATSPAQAKAGHNTADVAFAQQMIPHHRQAVTMAEMAEEKASSADVKALAAEIKKAQAPEITTMSGWLKAWGEDVPVDAGSAMPGMHHASSDMPGMMSERDMTALGRKSGRAFDTAFLTMMVEHHQGAVDMARTERTGGAFAPARTLAGAVITAQTAEIAQMKKMLGKD